MRQTKLFVRVGGIVQSHQQALESILPTAGKKQSWQKTKRERVGPPPEEYRGTYEMTYWGLYPEAVREHKSEVAFALAAGLPVPVEVLADYPDLVTNTANP